MLLEREQSLQELTRLFQRRPLSGSMAITLKKYDGQTEAISRKGFVVDFESSDNKCLLRATYGIKISVVVSSKELNKFQREGSCKPTESSCGWAEEEGPEEEE